ncbi:unnamed protein product [Discosporangium mesarthrocarpum]
MRRIMSSERTWRTLRWSSLHRNVSESLSQLSRYFLEPDAMAVQGEGTSVEPIHKILFTSVVSASGATPRLGIPVVLTNTWVATASRDNCNGGMLRGDYCRAFTLP